MMQYGNVLFACSVRCSLRGLMQTFKRTQEHCARAIRCPAPTSMLANRSMPYRLDTMLHWCRKEPLLLEIPCAVHIFALKA